MTTTFLTVFPQRAEDSSDPRPVSRMSPSFAVVATCTSPRRLAEMGRRFGRRRPPARLLARRPFAGLWQALRTPARARRRRVCEGREQWYQDLFTLAQRAGASAPVGGVGQLHQGGDGGVEAQCRCRERGWLVRAPPQSQRAIAACPGGCDLRSDAIPQAEGCCSSDQSISRAPRRRAGRANSDDSARRQLRLDLDIFSPSRPLTPGVIAPARRWRRAQLNLRRK